MAGIAPFGINILLIAFWILLYFITKKKVKNDLITSLVISNFILQPSVIDALAKILKCKEIDKGKFFIFYELSSECYTDMHYSYVFFI